jgi:hypothetical protein
LCRKGGAKSTFASATSTDVTQSFWKRLEELDKPSSTRASPSTTEVRVSNEFRNEYYRNASQMIWNYPLWNQGLSFGNTVLLLFMLCFLWGVVENIPSLDPIVVNLLGSIKKLLENIW